MDVHALRDTPREQPERFLDREAHVWLFDLFLTREEMWKEKLTNILSAEERERADRFVLEQHFRFNLSR